MPRAKKKRSNVIQFPARTKLPLQDIQLPEPLADRFDIRSFYPVSNTVYELFNTDKKRVAMFIVTE